MRDRDRSSDGFLRKRESERLVNRFRGGDSGGGTKVMGWQR